MATNNSKIVITEQSQGAGALVYWSLRAGVVQYDKFCAAWIAGGGHPDCLPDAPSRETALRRAMSAQKSARQLARTTATRGNWALVVEYAEKDDLDYDVTARAHLDEVGQLVVRGNEKHTQRITESFNYYLDHINHDDISAWLVDMLDDYHSVRMKPNGGLYYIPEHESAAFERVATLVEKISGKLITIEFIPAQNRASVVKAVLDGLLEEMVTFTNNIDQQIADGVGKRGLTNRIADCDRQIERMSAYESLIGPRVAKLCEHINAVRARVVLATLRLDDDEAA